MPLSMTRAELSALCEEETGKLKTMVRDCIADAGIEAGSLADAQATGGGCRMPVVMEAIGAEVSVSGSPCMRCEGLNAPRGCVAINQWYSF